MARLQLGALTSAARRAASAGVKAVAEPSPPEPPVVPPPPPSVRGGPPTTRLLAGMGAEDRCCGAESRLLPVPAKASGFDSLPQRAPMVKG